MSAACQEIGHHLAASISSALSWETVAASLRSAFTRARSVGMLASRENRGGEISETGISGSAQDREALGSLGRQALWQRFSDLWQLAGCATSGCATLAHRTAAH